MGHTPAAFDGCGRMHLEDVMKTQASHAVDSADDEIGAALPLLTERYRTSADSSACANAVRQS
jgi:hypothetical protein